jgi:hypothetical protein
VRAQLLSLDEHHDRELHDAAVGLRRQLDELRESRRQTRLNGRSHHWGSGRTGWGRWESPQQQERSREERRAIKEETRATRKVFREVLRRAREEQRERRRKDRSGLKRETARKEDEAEDGSVPLDQRLQNLELTGNRESRSTVQSFPSPTRSVSEVSTVSSPISTPSTVSLQSTRNVTAGKPGSSRTEASEKKSEGTGK